MRICELCGNHFPKTLSTCPYCSHEHNPVNPSCKPYPTINIKQTLPTVEEARQSMVKSLQTFEARGAKVVKIIHGYGSTGVGGKIKAGVRTTLVKQIRAGSVKNVIFGENFDSDNTTAVQLVKRHPKLATDHDYNRKNFGITLIEL